MSSHREAPAISQDPVADNADVYAFVSPDDPTTVTIITNYVPLEGPAGGPNFFEFGDDVLYSIFIDNDGDAMPDITYQFRFRTTLQNEDTFLYNTGPDRLADGSELEQAPALLSVARSTPATTRHHERDGEGDVLGNNLACPPCNIGPALDAELRRSRGRRGAPPADRRDGVRRSAERRLLRRPGRDLRPRRPSASSRTSI